LTENAGVGNAAPSTSQG